MFTPSCHTLISRLMDKFSQFSIIFKAWLVLTYVVPFLHVGGDYEQTWWTLWAIKLVLMVSS